MNDMDLRREALAFANGHLPGDVPSRVVERAQAYYEFMKKGAATPPGPPSPPAIPSARSPKK